MGSLRAKRHLSNFLHNISRLENSEGSWRVEVHRAFRTPDSKVGKLANESGVKH